MKKIIVSAVLATVLCLGMYFGMVWYGVAFQNAVVTITFATFVTFATFAFIFPATATAVAAFTAFTVFTAVATITTTAATAVVTFAIVIIVIVTFAFVTFAFVVSGVTKESFWKVMSVYSVEALVIFFSIYLHLQSTL